MLPCIFIYDHRRRIQGFFRQSNFTIFHYLQLLLVYPHKLYIMNFVQVVTRASHIMPVDRKFRVGFFYVVHFFTSLIVRRYTCYYTYLLVVIFNNNKCCVEIIYYFVAAFDSLIDSSDSTVPIPIVSSRWSKIPADLNDDQCSPSIKLFFVYLYALTFKSLHSSKTQHRQNVYNYIQDTIIHNHNK